MLGMVFARLNESARGENPSTQASTKIRTSPVMREARVPVAIEKTRELCERVGLIWRGDPSMCAGAYATTKER